MSLGGAADWADPTVWKFFIGGFRRDITIRVSLFRIVDVTTDFALPFFHVNLLSVINPKFENRNPKQFQNSND